jgi:hypothetical protein
MSGDNAVIAMPGQSVSRTSGENFTVVIPSPRCFVDSHSHIENGACAPLPLLWDQAIILRYLERKEIDDMSTKGVFGLLFSALKGRAGQIQVQPTSKIGDILADAINQTFEGKSTLGQSEHYKFSDLLSCAVVMMMDMEYAHIAGYNGQTIYHEDEEFWYYYMRESGKAPENKGKKLHLFEENLKNFVRWEKQVSDTIDALKTNPFRINAMYHYDPRRWNYSKSLKTDEAFQFGPWNYPFEEVVTKTRKGLFVGFKMYPSLGYKPLDKRLPYMHDPKDGGCFYARCMSEGIPILTHCSPGGMTTHEMKYYMELDTPSISNNDKGNAIKYFYDNYVHPRAWRDVFKKYKDLKVCLAHFGGDLFPKGPDNDWIKEIIDLIHDYPNVYTDISCWNINKSKETFVDLLSHKKYNYLKDRILFGTDWYMTLLAVGGKSYQTYCEEFYELFKLIPGGRELWIRLTFLNPFEFYGLNEKKILDNMNSALIDINADKTKRETNYKLLCRLQEEYKNLREKLGKYQKA